VWAKGGTSKEFKFLETLNFEFTKFGKNLFPSDALQPVGHLLDPAFTMDVLKEFKACHDYGECIGCDTKQANNRLQSLTDNGVAHCSVEIKNIKWPEGLNK